MTLAVVSASMTTQQLARHTGYVLSNLSKSYLGVEHMTSEIKPTDFGQPKSKNGAKFVEDMADKTTDKIKLRMKEVISMSLNASRASRSLLMLHENNALALACPHHSIACSQLLKNSEAVRGRYQNKGMTDYQRPKPLHCCKLGTGEYPDVQMEYDPSFFGETLTDQMCMKAPDGSTTFDQLVLSLDADVTRSTELQQSFKDNLDESKEIIKWQYYGGLWHTVRSLRLFSVEIAHHRAMMRMFLQQMPMGSSGCFPEIKPIIVTRTTLDFVHGT